MKKNVWGIKRKEIPHCYEWNRFLKSLEKLRKQIIGRKSWFENLKHESENSIDTSFNAS